MKETLSLVLAMGTAVSLAACGSSSGSSTTAVDAAVSTQKDAAASAQKDAAVGAQSDTAATSTQPDAQDTSTLTGAAEVGTQTEAAATSTATSDATRSTIEKTLNLANNPNQEWTYSKDADAWTLAIVSAVVYPEIPNEQGVSVCVPGAYVTGIDSNGDGKADITAATYTAATKGSLVIDYQTKVTSPNGQVYTAATAPVILNTGAAGYASQTNQTASTSYASDGYINVACGNRGKQDTASNSSGKTYYTGDAPSCLVDQKNAARFVKYNILLGNLPGNVDYLVSTGGSGGGAHATMFSATSNHPDFYDYEIEAGAVGVYRNADGSYSTSVTIGGKSVELSDGAWGSIAYSAITSLYEADMDMALEYFMDTKHAFNTPFQAKVAEYLSADYMKYINDQKLSVKESAVGLDLNQDGDQDDTIALTIEYDPKAHPESNGYYGTYLDLYLARFIANLQWYVDNLDYGTDWTWFDENGQAASDAEVAAMTSADKVRAFLAGRYAKGSSGSSSGGPGGGMTGGMTGFPDGGTMGGPPGATTGTPPGGTTTTTTDAAAANGNVMEVGTPTSGTTQSSSSKTDSSNYASFADMVAAYKTDIDGVYAGDKYGKNIVSLYNPLSYIGAQNTANPTWTRIVMGGAEGDMSMFASLNLQIKWLSAGVDAEIEWQWDGGHVPSEVFGNSFALYVDQMYGKHVKGAVTITKAAASKQAKNGTATAATGKDISSWVSYDSSTGGVSFSLAAAAAYRTAGASKATPGFDVMDYGQEDYVFGDQTQDARHWNKYLLEIFQTYPDVLSPLFDKSN